MGKVISFEVIGVKELKKDIQDLGEHAMPRLKFGFLQFLSMVADSARIKVSVKTGHLQSSITHQISRESKTILEGRVGSNVIYAPYVEMGTGIYGPSGKPIRPKSKKVLAWVTAGARPTTPDGWNKAVKEGRAIMVKEIKGMRPKPFLLPALEENINKLVDILRKTLK